MIGFNHASVGGFISKVLPLPLALPVAFASHFVLDSMPHYGIEHHKRDDWFWKVFTSLDFLLAWGYLGTIGVMRHHYAVLACGIAAASPDFVWVYIVIRSRSFNLSEKNHWFNKWHGKIQFERPWGIYVEIPLAVTLGYLVFNYW